MIDTPAWWQLYMIVGEVYSLYVVSRSGFRLRYQAFAIASLSRTTINQRIVVGCAAVAVCTALWLPFLTIKCAAGFIAGCRAGWRRK